MKDKRTFDQLNDNIMVIKIIFKISIGLKHNVRLNTLYGRVEMNHDQFWNFK